MLLLLILFVSITGMAQTKIDIKGIVTDKNKEPLIGATVIVKGTSQGTVTAVDGSFSLTVPSKSTLVVSSIGYRTGEIAASGNKMMSIILDEETQMVEEVVVVAYGTAKKSSFTGSVSAISSEKIGNLKQANPASALQGMSAGVNVLNQNGTPGDDPVINIRGIGSMSASTTPLYVVDGMPYDGQISAISPNDIESISVLKDAAASSLYGSRAANGVVVITTKKARSEKATVNFNANWGFSDLAVAFPKMAGPGESFEMWWEAFYNDGIANNMSEAEARAYASKNYMDHNITATQDSKGNTIYVNPYNTSDPLDEYGKLRSDAQLVWNESDWDWYGAMVKKRLRQEYSIDISGMGNDKKMNYLFSASYLDDKGMSVGQMFKRYTLRTNITNEVKSWLKLGLNMNYAHTRKTWSYAGVRFLRTMPSYYSPWLRNADNTDWIYNEVTGDRMFDYGSYRKQWGWWNTLGDSQATDSDNKGSYKFDMGYVDLLSARTFAEFKLLEGLTFRSNLSLDNQSTKTNAYDSAIHGYYQNGADGWGSTVVTGGGAARKDGSRQTSTTWNNILTYDKMFGSHHINLLAGQEFYAYRYEYMYAYGAGISLPGFFELGSVTTNKDVDSYKDTYNLLSFFGKAEYDYDNKYYVSASYRRDGSSRFHPDSRWGNFFSVGASWRLSKEKFMEGTTAWLDNLSLKASYGTTGNDNLNTFYAYQGTYASADVDGNSYNMYTNPGIGVNTIATPDLKWEKNEQFNAGLDFATLGNRLNGSIEYFSRSAKDLLYYREVPPSVTTGNATGYNTNLGNIRNSGLELTISATPFSNRDFTWNIDYNLTWLKNEITYLPGGDYTTGVYKMAEGKSRYEFFGVRYAGVDPETGKSLYWRKIFDEAGNVTGEEKTTDYKSVQVDSQKEYLGSAIPKAYGGLTNSFRYRDFDFSFMLYYSLGSKIRDAMYQESSKLRQGFAIASEFVENRWKQAGDVAEVPRLTVDGTETYNGIITSDRFIYNNDYLRLRNLSLGYTLPKSLLNKIGIDRVRVYLTGDNLLTFGKAASRGTDPETDVSGEASDGDKGGHLSTNKTFTGGIQVTF